MAGGSALHFLLPLLAISLDIPVQVPDKKRLAQLHDFNAEQVDHSIGDKYSSLRNLTECVLAVMRNSPLADQMPIFPIQGTSLAVLRGWQMPWDRDLDFGYESSTELGAGPAHDALFETWSGNVERYNSLKECKEVPLSADIDYETRWVHRVSRIEPGHMNLRSRIDFWPYGSIGDKLCGWICIPRAEIFPLRTAVVRFHEPGNASGLGYTLHEVTVPAMRNSTAFIDRYKPFQGARTDLPYNYYNNDLHTWQFNPEVHIAFNRGSGPQLVFEGRNAAAKKAAGLESPGSEA